MLKICEVKYVYGKISKNVWKMEKVCGNVKLKK